MNNKTLDNWTEKDANLLKGVKDEYSRGFTMFATVAKHLLGDISRKSEDYCSIYKEDEENYYGNWVYGMGFIAVQFPKKTTRPLTDDELQKFSDMNWSLGGFSTKNGKSRTYKQIVKDTRLDIFKKQFTGAKDVNGRDIHEGDKIVCHFQTASDTWDKMTGKSIGTVKYDPKECQFRVFFRGKHGTKKSQSINKVYGHVVITK